ncbi:D-alanyl-D-alanine carboxypeptidase / D-alanyl-D-alanine-endopeptidase (penicillin-binding protein 4) [Saccharopolyspora kobensis]|uniref:D-alanyl-D-alanine carboxypeptidase / D-alanyl-D-alanine-endopeptidase (Penicillin-binding protein 4) n=1 Tax=Saccharopolyspora kobensis TaxID=146035 RepID=A0A1H6C446_9PSEU|nr:D-alanyl-D-alanine carboxypeptidase/D-alanyl-D-alanine-endopeptidase [Saccharopolyspora kobensis]SEG67749.1 D-alanyl-D-alanine carboxypeptidase / D-alanyl-D-alanine-endopeptidase (penicillin-binding protein 4) [Saccharopolyspora kobensis]SFC27329.1 D-alanyl-D-alanine carboxypeptidase / D-alanyl-D-alanine-endopeptidase (penicillin-binding protein 4) [Saccharopolyspora kobensis]
MRRRWGVAFGLVVAVGIPFAFVAPSGAAPTGPDALRVDLDEILADPRLAGSHAGVVVRDPATDEVLYSRQAAARATPASNAKLLTSAAAMEALGPDYRFRTEVVTGAQQAGPVLLGDLHLRGTGDPTLLAADYDRLAEQVAAAGIRFVQGGLRTDDTWFDDVPLGTGWAWDDEPYYYAAPVSALTASPNTDFDAGTAIVRVSPTVEGAPAEVRLDPATDVVRIENRTTTSAEGEEPDVLVQRDHGGSRVVVSGTVPAGAEPVEDFTTVPDPSAYAADLFTRALAAHGVRVRNAGEGTAPEGARVLAERESIPLRELLVPFMKLSNNGHAEVLVKAMGREVRGEGSWAAGLEVLTERLGELGLSPEVLRLVDGSGLSTMDNVTPEQLTVLLDNARQRPWFPAWYDSLPVAGVADRMVGGTLRNRMAGTAAENNVRAKTGSLTGVTSLSGYVTTAGGRELVFSVVFNDFVSGSPKDLEDAIAVRLAEYRGAEDQPRGRTRVPQPRIQRDDPATGIDEGALECSWVKAC